MSILRTPEMYERYQEHIAQGGLVENGCPLCREGAIKGFTYWKIIPNDFPYDRIASTHHMLVPLRHVAEDGLTAQELQEFKEIKSTYLNEEYQLIIEATRKNKSIPTHFHLHLIVGKE